MPSILIVTRQNFTNTSDLSDFIRSEIKDSLPKNTDFLIQPVNFPEKLLIDDVRSLQARLAAAGGQEPLVFALTDMHATSGVVQNALLKLLEEPPTNVYLVLLTNTLENILPTVQSRCRIYRPQSKFAAKSAVFPSLVEIAYGTWHGKTASQLAALLTKAFTDNQKTLKKSHPDLTQTLVTQNAFTSYLEEITTQLPQSADPDFDRRVLAALAKSLPLLQANVSPKNVYYFLAIDIFG